MNVKTVARILADHEPRYRARGITYCSCGLQFLSPSAWREHLASELADAP